VSIPLQQWGSMEEGVVIVSKPSPSSAKENGKTAISGKAASGKKVA